MKASLFLLAPAILSCFSAAANAEKAKIFNFDVLEEKALNPVPGQDAKNPLEGIDLDQLVNVVYITLEPSTVFVTVTRTLHQVVTTATTTVTAETDETPLYPFTGPTSKAKPPTLNTTAPSVSVPATSTLPPSGNNTAITATSTKLLSSSHITPSSTLPSSTTTTYTEGKLDFVIGKEKKASTDTETASYYDELVQFVSSVFSPPTSELPSSTGPIVSTPTSSSSLAVSSSSTKSKTHTSTRSASIGFSTSVLHNTTHNSTKNDHDDYGDVLDGFNPYKDLPLSDIDVNFSNDSPRLNARGVVIGMSATIFIFGVFAL
ncbi:hypothetical protein KL942_001659 [Ogataea angusta]|uniref:Uncharacterized protein n=1 Tax=Pichia angusta TaxID=870730 RepID=A0AAN6DGM6_PICAN|nr:uncharacterized protein KL928_002549 [Ogataea angusta]KAG7818681.1 hypothetical protein KL928_002549 [Ogataea angusta]KAG7841780.1 hypothetical protein KL942_001659 [Ogataea angusta]KAG7850642.1 hypothetical protein KL940_001219 [Ogataea angusta]